MPVITPDLAAQGAAHLSAHDPVLAPLIATYGLPDIKPHTNYYQDLVESIIGQQLSVKAADTINRRLRALFDGVVPTPQQIIATDHDTLRSIGLSGQKANYVRDLAGHVLDGRLTFDNLDALSNAEIIAKLTDVKGIGEWTAHMFLMFCMGRSDILAHGDLGIRNGVRKLYNIELAPGPADLQALAVKYQWHPYETMACWYIWRALDNKPV
jgi:DNA-3-methyladenine glycosylase II